MNLTIITSKTEIQQLLLTNASEAHAALLSDLCFAIAVTLYSITELQSVLHTPPYGAVK